MQKNGGLQVPDFKMMVNVFKSKWLIRYFTGPSHKWKNVLRAICLNEKVNVQILLHTNYASQNSNAMNFPMFNHKALYMWADVVKIHGFQKFQII